MDITGGQVATIANWARSKGDRVREAWLFGSRATGTSRPNSDFDVALALGGDDQGAQLGLVTALFDRWQEELQHALAARVSLQWLEAREVLASTRHLLYRRVNEV